MYLKTQLYTGERLDFEIKKNALVIGRSSKCDVVIPYNGISRQHVKVEIVNGDIFITDLDSINGVTVQGERIVPSSRFKYDTYLNLSFGCVESLQMEVEKTASIKFERHVDKDELPQKKAGPQRARREGPMFPKEIKQKTPYKDIAINVLAIAVMLFVFYYIYQDRTPGNSNVIQKPKPKTSQEDYF